MSPMPMLTSLILEYTHLDGQQLDKWFPNLQVLNLVQVTGLQDPNIRLLNLKTCLWDVIDYLRSLTLITPNLTTFKFKSMKPAALHLEAPKLSQFYLDLYVREFAGALTVKKFENLKTLWLDVFYIGSRSSFSAFPITKTVESLTLHSRYGSPTDSNLTLGKVFTVFPNVSSLCIKSGAWSELEACFNRQGWEILDGRKGLKTIRAYLMSIDPLLTFSFVSCLLDQCVGLLEVSLFINADYPDYYDDDDDDDDASESFMSKCMARWPGLKWTWGEWSEFMEDLNDPWYT
ncbi:hypothetical protein E3N88_28952 [Mikania micrantha]|uniref:FBD domain-containing protein n=1 Tax=Mikania micrantha TaxID=192012 RepID=A0A5N6N1H5_9ASTR|nr:hypothetical protein E3N88_28952 [Mikania micrantha]